MFLGLAEGIYILSENTEQGVPLLYTLINSLIISFIPVIKPTTTTTTTAPTITTTTTTLIKNPDLIKICFLIFRRKRKTRIVYSIFLPHLNIYSDTQN